MTNNFKTYKWMLNSKAAIAFGVVLFVVYTVGLIFFGDQWFLSFFNGNRVINGFLVSSLTLIGYILATVICWRLFNKLKLVEIVRGSISIFILVCLLSIFSSIYLWNMALFQVFSANNIDIFTYNELFFSVEHFIVSLIAVSIFTIGYAMLFQDPGNEIREAFLDGIMYLKPLTEKFTNRKEASIISIQTETDGNSFKLDIEKFIYARAEGNYTDLFIQNEGGGLKKETKRILISKLEEQIVNNSNGTTIFRTHKSYIVNLNMIDSFKGNSNGFKIFLRLIFLQEIPVSRANVSSFKNKLVDLDLV